MPKTLVERCKSTLSSQKARAKKKYGVVLDYTWEDLFRIVPIECCWCHDKLTPSKINFDHKIPVARGGAWTVENLAAICASCNRRKGELTAHEYDYLLHQLAAITKNLGSDYVAKNVLKRIAAGSAWIHG